MKENLYYILHEVKTVYLTICSLLEKRKVKTREETPLKKREEELSLLENSILLIISHLQ